MRFSLASLLFASATLLASCGSSDLMEVRDGPQLESPYGDSKPTPMPVTASIPVAPVQPVQSAVAQAPAMEPALSNASVGYSSPVFAAANDPIGDVPLLVQACVNSVWGNFTNADIVTQRGYSLQRNSETRRTYYRKFATSTFAMLNGETKSARLSLRGNSIRRENYCTIEITSSGHESSVRASAISTLQSLGYQSAGGQTWTNGAHSLELSGSMSGSRSARRVSVYFTARQ
ncbi:hypothetical protein [Thalassovita mangrovi]|uniref:Lipoprotein n=1 Tax=Thalassovita mangrovi TaxID=2692236 RepID=A0A6L8LUL2_9RHOB|nr:hypothetical protein [Thalassovita mangrovi]MYM57012.1 hypothetical protein [Thalassovita mangrovi]